MMNSIPERDTVLEDLNEAQHLPDIASKIIVRALASKGHLAAVGQTVTARRLLDEAKGMISRAARWASAA